MAKERGIKLKGVVDGYQTYKNEQKVQKDHLKQYQRYLPTLQLKKQQLQSVIMKTKAELEQKEVERAQMIGDLDDWVAVFAENEIFDEEKNSITWYSQRQLSVRMRTSQV